MGEAAALTCTCYFRHIHEDCSVVPIAFTAVDHANRLFRAKLPLGRELKVNDMPAYIHHTEVELGIIGCPNCKQLPMYVSCVDPHWSVAKIDFTYECSDCGATLTKTMTRPEQRH